MTSRETQAQAFVTAHHPQATLVPLPQDASHRRYYRVGDTGGPMLLMDCPPGQEDLDGFVRVARYLQSLELGAPQVYQFDQQQGFALIEDFGEQTFTRLLEQGHDPEPLYRLATNVLVALRQRAVSIPTGFPEYSIGQMAELACLVLDWYVPAHTGEPVTAVLRDAFLDQWSRVLDTAFARGETLVLRDFHVDNLMLREDQEGLLRCGLLDFQDAARGPALYDLASLLEDARRRIDPALKAAMKKSYTDALGLDLDDDFEAAFTVAAAQRHCRVAGVFARLVLRDGRKHYQAYLPEATELLSAALEHPLLQGVNQVLADACPQWQTVPHALGG